MPIDRPDHASQRHTSGVTTRLILCYVRDHGGEQAVHAVLERAGEAHRADELEDERTWSSYGTKIALFEAAAEVLGDEAVARRIGESVITAQVAGPLKAIISALGTPQRVLRGVAKANAKFSTSGSMRADEARAGRAVVAYRLDPEHTPSHHDCRYTQGILSQATVLFGLPPATIAHEDCQVEGAAECRYEITWRLRDTVRRRRRRQARSHIEAVGLRSQLEDLQRTAAELVRVSDLDQLLERIAGRAGSAVRAQRHLLVVHLPGEERARAVGEGFDEATARTRSRALLDDVDDADEERLVTDIVSGGRRYGRLAAYLPAGTGFHDGEQALLDSYAALTAAALDNAVALRAARRRGSRNHALLGLARTLALARTEDDVADAVASAVRPILEADVATVALWVPEEEALVTRAAAGFPAELAAAAAAFRTTVADTPALVSMLSDPTPAIYTDEDPDIFVRSAVSAFGTSHVAVAPILVREQFAGTVIAGWRGEGPPATDADLLDALSSVADQASLAIGNVRMIAEVQHRATHDPLTGLVNRTLFVELASAALRHANRTGEDVGVCFLDLDGFKSVNDRAGHAAGDAVLIEVAERLRGAVRETDVVARLSGDEFGVLLTNPGSCADVGVVAARMVDAIARPFSLPDGSASIGVSIGIAMGPRHGTDPDALLRHADLAMYRAKAVGSTHRFHELTC